MRLVHGLRIRMAGVVILPMNGMRHMTALGSERFGLPFAGFGGMCGHSEGRGGPGWGGRALPDRKHRLGLSNRVAARGRHAAR